MNGRTQIYSIIHIFKTVRDVSHFLVRTDTYLILFNVYLMELVVRANQIKITFLRIYYCKILKMKFVIKYTYLLIFNCQLLDNKDYYYYVHSMFG